MAAISSPTARPTLNLRRLGLAALIGGALAALINAVIFFVAGAAGVDFTVPMPPTNELQPMPVIAVIMSSILPAFVAAGFLALLIRFTKNPLQIFTIVGAVFLVLSFASPFSLGVSLATVMTLNLMHVIAGVAIIVALRRAAA